MLREVLARVGFLAAHFAASEVADCAIDASDDLASLCAGALD